MVQWLFEESYAAQPFDLYGTPNSVHFLVISPGAISSTVIVNVGVSLVWVNFSVLDN